MPLLEAVESGECDLAVAAFERKVGGGLGLAKGYARWAIRRLCGFEAVAPISGQRAMRAAVLRDVLPFAARYGMEIGMTVDAVRAGHRVAERSACRSPTARPAGPSPASRIAAASSATSSPSIARASANRLGPVERQ